MTELEDKSASDSEEEAAVSGTSFDDIDMDSDEEVISYYCTITKGEFCAETDDFGDASNNLDYIFFELQLQEAFAAGLIKPGLNSVQEVTKKRPKINNVAGLRQKLDEFRQHHYSSFIIQNCFTILPKTDRTSCRG